MQKWRWPSIFLIKFDADILRMSEDEEKAMLKLYWEAEEPLFITYEHAFILFYRIATQLGNNEVILSNALSVTHDAALRQKLLKEYLAKDDIKYRSYADNLLAGQMFAGLRAKKLTLVDHFDLRIKQGDEFITLTGEDEEDTLTRHTLENVLRKYSSRKVMYMKDIRLDDMEQYRKLMKMQSFSFVNIISQGNRTELHILDPSYWDVFMKLGVNEIEFVNISIVESRKSERTKTAYDSALVTTYADILMTEKRSKNVTIVVNTLREKEDCLMKYAYGREYGMKFKQPAKIQFEELFKDHLDQMEVSMRRADTRNIQYDGGLGF